MGKKVPPILLSGDHKKVDEWRLEQSVIRTKERRPDLYEKWLAENPPKPEKKKRRKKKAAEPLASEEMANDNTTEDNNIGTIS